MFWNDWLAENQGGTIPNWLRVESEKKLQELGLSSKKEIYLQWVQKAYEDVLKPESEADEKRYATALWTKQTASFFAQGFLTIVGNPGDDPNEWSWLNTSQARKWIS
jgi:hypothetical protein